MDKQDLLKEPFIELLKIKTNNIAQKKQVIDKKQLPTTKQ